MSYWINYIRILFFIIIGLTSISKTQAQITNNEDDSAAYFASHALKYYQKDSFNLAFNFCNRALILYGADARSSSIASIYQLKGYMYLSRGAHAKAIESFSRANYIGEELGSEKIQMAALHGLGRVHIEIENYIKADSFLLAGLHMAEKNRNIRTEAIFNNALGLQMKRNNKHKQAIAYFQKFKLLSTQIEDTLSIIYANINVGDSYTSINQLDTAYKYFKIAEHLNTFVENSQAKAAILGNLGRILLKREKYIESIEYVNQSMKLCFDNDFSDFIIENYYLLIKNHQSLGDEANALLLFEKLDAYKDSLYKVNEIKKYEGLQAQLLMEEKAAKAAFWEQKFYNRNIILGFSIAMSILIIALMVLLYSRFKNNKMLHKQETKSLHQTIDEKNRELVTRVMSENQQMSSLGELGKTLSFISKETDLEKIKRHLENTLREMANKEHIGDNWSTFKVHFEKVHPEFFNALKKQGFNLTQSELRTCAYIKMNLTTKEIANLLNISDRSVQTNRYRLKKKMKLNTNDNLISFIQSI